MLKIIKKIFKNPCATNPRSGVKKNVIVYTAIFGGRDKLLKPKVLPSNCDFVCFTDTDIASSVWDVRKKEPVSISPVRSAKIYKVLPHKYFSQYEYSVWVDGNLLIKGDVNKLINKYLEDVDLAAYDHTKSLDSRDCVYDEADALIKAKERGRYKTLDSGKIKNQMEEYRKDGYPEHNGLITTMVILRRHNAKGVIKTMENWWSEIVSGSRRDQLSFNYVAWKNNLKFNYIHEDSRKNEFFKHVSHKG